MENDTENIIRRLFADGVTREVWQDQVGQYVRDDDGEKVYGVRCNLYCPHCTYAGHHPDQSARDVACPECHLEAITEASWLGDSEVPFAMVQWLRCSCSRRKLRLAGCAGIRHIWDMIKDPAVRGLLVFAEQEAEGWIHRDKLRRLVQPVSDAISRSRQEAEGLIDEFLPLGQPVPDAILQSRAERECSGALALCQLASPNSVYAGAEGGYLALELTTRVGRKRSWVHQRAILRDIIRDPFYPRVTDRDDRATIDPSWLTWRDSTIQRLARSAYEERELPSGRLDAGRLAILADALEEAGCTNEDILAHLRGPGPHVRGCWVIDLLRKE